MAQQNLQPNPPLDHERSLAGRLGKLAALNPRQLVELFIVANLAFLGFDVFLAHAVNRFAHSTEWIPLAFSAASVVVLVIAMAMGGLTPVGGTARNLGLLVGWCSVVVGVAGLVLHLDSQFFNQWTLKSLVYTAPFTAPLAYAGLGLLLIMNRMAPADSREWARWIIFMTWGGFIGDFILSVADHAANGFFVPAEWIAVGASAMAVGFLLMPLIMTPGRVFLNLCLVIMAIEVGIGLLGFYFHVRANLRGPSSRLRDNFLFGAPTFAPLLFANLAILGAIGLWHYQKSAPSDEQ